MKKRVLSILLTIATITCLLPTGAMAASPINVLALGDSITTGFGLPDAETESFPALLEDHYNVTNKAVNGNTITGIATQLNTGAIPAQEIAAADVITITAGGNDIMALFYARIAELYQTENHTSITAADVAATLKGLHPSNLLQNYALLQTAEQLMNKKNSCYFANSQEFTHALTAYQQTLIRVTSSLKESNPDARIIVATQYNPYVEFADHPYFHSFYAGMEESISMLNTTITDGAAAGRYLVADVKTAFQKDHSPVNDLYNADPDIHSINLDFHPSANGHKTLAKVFKASIEESQNHAPSPDTGTFADISSDAYYIEAVKWAVENGITSGTSTTTFSPDAGCSRAQVMTFLWRAAGSPSPEGTKMPFNDVPADSYYHDAILWAIEKNIAAGTSAATFSPDAECSRGQIMTFLWRMQQTPAVSGVNTFFDVAADSYYSNAILWAVKNNITSGTSATTFSPDATCTRAQIVTFLWRAGIN